MNENSHHHVIAGDAEGFEIGHCLVQAAAGQSADAGQFVSRDTLVGRRIHQVTHDVQKLPASHARDAGGGQDCLDLFQLLDPQRGGKDLYPVFFAGQQFCLFEPGNGCLDPGVVGCAVTLELQIPVGAYDLARRCNNFAVFRGLAIKPAQCLQDRANLVPRQP